MDITKANLARKLHQRVQLQQINEIFTFEILI